MAYYEVVGEYPENLLPLPQSNFSGSLKTPIQTTQFASGRVRRRKIGRTTVKLVNFEWLLSPEEYDSFERWFEDGLDSGVNKFSISMCTGGTGQTGVHVVQFIGEPSFSYEECNWRVSVEGIIHPYPVRPDDDDALSLYLNEHLGNFYPIYVNYLNKEYV